MKNFFKKKREIMNPKIKQMKLKTGKTKLNGKTYR